MSKSREMVNLYMQRLKERYIYLIIMTIIIGFFTYLYNDSNNSIISGGENEIQMPILNNEIRQDIKIEHDNPKEIVINLGEHEKINESSIYDINVFNGDEVIATLELDLSTLEDDQNISISMPKLGRKDASKLTIQIKGDNTNVNNALKINTFKSNNNQMYIDGVQGTDSLSTIVTYSRFSIVYMTIIILLYIALCFLILYIDVNKIHNGVFIIIILLGAFSAVLNPILDTPDEQAHVARAELTSRGVFFVKGDASEYNISKSMESILNNIQKTFENDELISTDGNFDYSGITNTYAETNIFFSYIPQAIGILLAKIFSINTLSILTFGRILNLLAYALMVRFAIKIAPSFKLPIAIISMMPMVIFVAASFNPDASTYGLTFILIAYFLKLYKQENINIKQMIIFSVISILLGFVKLPYCILGGLIIFLPKEKFADKRAYYKSFVFVLIIAVVSLAWGLKSVMGGSGNSPFNSYYIENNISVSDQIVYILQNPKTFIIGFVKSLFDNLNIYISQINIFGWLTYSLNPTLMILYPAFVIVVVFTYPNNMEICRKTKLGLGLMVFGVYVITNLILYLSWTPVGSSGIEGVQGRYFCSLLVLLTLFSNRQVEGINEEKMNLKYIFIAMVFVAIFLVTLVNRAY